MEGWGAASGQTPDVTPTTSQRGRVLVLRAAQALAQSPCCLARGPLALLGGNSGGDFLLQRCARQLPWAMLLLPESSGQSIQVPEAQRAPGAPAVEVLPVSSSPWVEMVREARLLPRGTQGRLLAVVLSVYMTGTRLVFRLLSGPAWGPGSDGDEPGAARTRLMLFRGA